MHYGLEGQALHDVIAAENQMFDCKGEYPGALAIVLCNSARVSAAVFRETNEVLANAPDKIAEVVDKINQAARENQRFIDGTGQDLARAAKDLGTAAWKVHEEQMAFAKERALWRKEKWFWVRMIIGGCAVCLTSVIYSTVLANNTQRITQQAVEGFKKEAIPLTARATAVSELQRLQIARGRYNAEQKVWEAEWEACMTEIGNGKPTEEQEEKKARLTETYAELLERREAILEREKIEGWAIK